MSWVVSVNEKLGEFDISQEMEHWKKQSIYRVPACVTDLNRKAYKPQTVSFGPYHHGEKDLMLMEGHKQRALLHFLKRSNKPVGIYVEALQSRVQELRDSYDWIDPMWNDENLFLQLMILDGCFILEVLRSTTGVSNDYAYNDPIFSQHGKIHIMPYIRRDMLMIQNQIPMLLLEILLAVETEKEKNEEFLNKMILKFCTPNQDFYKMGPCLHVLDVYRKSLLQDLRKKSRHTQKSPSLIHESSGNIIRSAVELHEAGIRFKRSKTTSLKDISFRGGVLFLPTIVVDDTTESTFLNLMAFERFHVGVGNEVTSYVFFMDNIIDSSKDVSLLHSSGIIQNAIGSDKAVAKLFNSLSKDVTLEPESSLDRVHKKVHDYCGKRWNEWRANLIHTYFRSPWAILSLVAAVVLMALTIAQTIYTIYPYYYPNDAASPESPPIPLAPIPSPH
ncbi:hypothetical protein FRX31_028565 [Thalictrum thalictroides]|uniref:Uncharacterized protein n=1 Tax=Thalictrum thalictroides TaxID=46969 RepID=A0A7J6VAM8_THATH|nr:hypothetical protein FRX31_028565 [Thalictrum thalictroides]